SCFSCLIIPPPAFFSSLSLHDALPILTTVLYLSCALISGHDNRPLLVMRSNLWASGYDVDGTDQTSLGQFSGRVQQTYKHSVPRSEERFSRNAETDLVCRLLLEKKNAI